MSDDRLPVGKPTEAATTNALNCFMLVVINDKGEEIRNALPPCRALHRCGMTDMALSNPVLVDGRSPIRCALPVMNMVLPAV
jgi:hypothetical protein